MIYAGIGSRETPAPVLDRMWHWGAYFARHGFTLRSGGARGADTAFQDGNDYARGNREMYTAADASKIENLHWIEHAGRFHPAWDRCSVHAKFLHARNSAIMLGASLNQPVDFVICWTKDGKASGGTGQALRIADTYQIPVFNMFHTDCEERLREWLGKASR